MIKWPYLFSFLSKVYLCKPFKFRWIDLFVFLFTVFSVGCLNVNVLANTPKLCVCNQGVSQKVLFWHFNSLHTCGIEFGDDKNALGLGIRRCQWFHSTQYGFWMCQLFDNNATHCRKFNSNSTCNIYFQIWFIKTPSIANQLCWHRSHCVRQANAFDYNDIFIGIRNGI